MKRSLAILTLFVALIACSKKPAGNTTGGEVVPPPVVPPASMNFKTLNYLKSISGVKTLAGVHNREPNNKPTLWTDSVYRATGRYPALWSGDFLFQQDNINNRQIMIDEAVRQWNKGAVINIMWHACNPALSRPCGWDNNGVLSKLNDQQWADLLTPGTTINTNWRAMIDEVCAYLQQLKEKNIEVLWRPLHEMNQGQFWWGGRPGANGTLKLYQQMHDYMVNTQKLTNLIWVWDIQDFGTLANDALNYDPGNAYWDIAALDVYEGINDTKYNIMVNVAKGKPIAIGECNVLPTTAVLQAQPKWTFFMSWAELIFKDNSLTRIREIYNDPNVITLDKMPGWR